VDVPEGVLAVLGDRARLEQAVQEILTNSAEAGARTIWVCGRAGAGGEVQIEIDDDGRGLAPGAETRAFDPFFTTKALGTGVGLTAARRIAEAHGGAVSIAPRPGGGTAVQLCLRAAPSAGAGG
jgi:signal transduction histidine kinase